MAWWRRGRGAMPVLTLRQARVVMSRAKRSSTQRAAPAARGGGASGGDGQATVGADWECRSEPQSRAPGPSRTASPPNTTISRPTTTAVWSASRGALRVTRALFEPAQGWKGRHAAAPRTAPGRRDLSATLDTAPGRRLCAGTESVVGSRRSPHPPRSHAHLGSTAGRSWFVPHSPSRQTPRARRRPRTWCALRRAPLVTCCRRGARSAQLVPPTLYCAGRCPSLCVPHAPPHDWTSPHVRLSVQGQLRS